MNFPSTTIDSLSSRHLELTQNVRSGIAAVDLGSFRATGTRLTRHHRAPVTPMAAGAGADSASSDSPQGHAAGMLENTTDNSSPRAPRAGMWRALDHLRTASSVKRQRSCMTGALGSTVGIRVSERGAGVSGVMHCGRVMCPACGPKIAVERRSDIERAVDAHRANGGTVLFMTLTLRHSRADTLGELVGVRSGGWKAVTGGKSWLRDRLTFGVGHYIRALEEKWSIENGWHVHVHLLVFIDHPPGSPAAALAVEGLLPAMFTRWRSYAVKAGMRAPLLRGQEAHEVTGDEAGKAMGDYFAKQASETVNDAARDMAWEMSNPNGKGRGDSFTPAEILGMAVDGDDTSAALWAEYEREMKGARTIVWSQGLRESLCMDEERTDEAIAEEEAGTVEDTVLSMTGRSWMKLARIRGARYELLRLVTTEGAGPALEYLQALGLTAVPGWHLFEMDME